MSFPRGRSILLLLLALAAPAPAARAWNATGHQVIAQIAWRELKPAAREKVLALLREHPHFARHLAPADVPADSPDFALRVFMRTATWADIVRAGRTKDEREHHHPEWHYINTPILAEGTDKAALELPPLGDKLEPGKPARNILQALDWCAQCLKDPAAPAAQRAVALAWLEHLVGDLHQPLHACAFFSPDYLKGDRGGNSFAVKHHGSVTNLHTFWDNVLGGYMAWRLVDAVTDKVVEKHSRESLAKELAATKFTEWSAESFALARDLVYAGGKLKGVTREAGIADQGATTPELPENYDRAARDAAQRRAALAGYRLADLLNKLFE